MNDESNSIAKFRHRGVSVSFWITNEQDAKLKSLSDISGLSRTAILKRLVDGVIIPNRSYEILCGRLASLGGYMKRFVDNGEHAQAFQVGQELVSIARELRRDAHAVNDTRQED